MPERIQQILSRILEWWRNLTMRQRILLVSAVGIVIAAVGIMVFLMTRPTYVTLIECENAEQSSAVQQLLTDNNITYQRSEDGMTYSVNKEDKADADILLGTNEIPTTGFTIDDALNGSFTTTEADKLKRYQVYLENLYEEELVTQTHVKSAKVTLSIPDDDGTLIANKEESYAKVMLEVIDKNTIDDIATWASNLAKYIATGLGNETTDRITIIDTDGNMLFAGGDESSSAGIASTNMSVRTQQENNTAQKIRTTLANANSDGSVYDDVNVAVNLYMDFSNTERTKYDYSVDEGRTEGYLDSETYSTSENSEGVTGVPGTDSNNETTYVLEDNVTSNSSTEDYSRDYLPDEEITVEKGEVGKIDYTQSSASITATTYVIYNEDDMKAAGQLEDMTFEEFRAQNSARVQAEVDDAVYNAVSRATGIPQANISIIAYEVPMFQYSEGGRDWTDILQLIIALLVFALLGFVVWRTLRKEKEEETEEEVTVEELIEQAQELQGEDAALLEEETGEEALEELGGSDKSEARLLIEKFVDENPDAVANLLRNWLNEDWG